MNKTVPDSRTLTMTSLLLLAGALLLPSSLRAEYASGSDGTYGPLSVTQNTTLAMPADGVFHCTTISVAAGATLRFTRNDRNTPVRLLATGDVSIAGTIDVSAAAGSSGSGGAGGPGGFDGGYPPIGADPAGDGHGPGAGLGWPSNCYPDGPGKAAFGNRAADANLRDGDSYGGPLLTSLAGGSGGGGCPGKGGGGGGGALLIASDTVIQLASESLLTARGGVGDTSYMANCGSGGAIRLVAPRVTGSLYVEVNSSCGAYGRARVDTLDRVTLAVDYRSTMPALTMGRFLRGHVANPPRLDVVTVGATLIPAGSSAVEISLPFGSPSSQDVTVRASGFTGTVNAELVVVPDNGPRVVYPLTFDMSLGDPRELTTTVELPLNMTSRVEAWSK